MKVADGGRRSYRMVARAAAAEETRKRIIRAAVEMFWSDPTTKVSLDDVAARAGVSVQTVIRHFGTKDGLFEAAVQQETGRVQEQRDEAPEGDVAGAVKVLLDHYEDLGDRVLLFLAEEHRPAVGEVVAVGRAYHRAWCERVFAAALAGLQGADRRRRLGQIVAVCDVYTWKLLRRDAGLSRRQTQLALVEMLQPMMGGS